jgi:arsenate reductase
MNPQRTAVLFVCTNNASRSQIAEELFRKIAPQGVDVFSAGVEPGENVHPMAAEILNERGINITTKMPRHVRNYRNESFGLIVTIGSRARDRTSDFADHPVRVYWDIDDPADAEDTRDSEKVFRQSLGAIEQRLPGLINILEQSVPDVSPFSPAISTTIVSPNVFEPAKHLPLIAQTGFSCIELCCNRSEKDFDGKSRKARQELISVSTDLGVKIRSVHAPGVYPRTYVDEALGRIYLDTTKAHCDIAAELGAKVVILHRLKTNEPGPPQWDRMMHDLLDELAEYVLSLPVVIGLENLNWRVVPDEDIDIVRAHCAEGMDFILDTGHAHLFGALDEYLALCGKCLCSVHIHDNDAIKDIHWLPGKGGVNWQAFMLGLVKTGYIGPLMIGVQDIHRQDDLPGLLDDCMAAVQMLQSYLPKELQQPQHPTRL